MGTVAWLTANITGSRQDCFFFYFSCSGRVCEHACVKWSNWRESFIVCQHTSGSQTHFLATHVFFELLPLPTKSCLLNHPSRRPQKHTLRLSVICKKKYINPPVKDVSVICNVSGADSLIPRQHSLDLLMPNSFGSVLFRGIFFFFLFFLVHLCAHFSKARGQQR